MTLAPAALWRGQTGTTASFVHDGFRRLWLAGVCSAVGQWTLLTARSALAFQLTGTNKSVGLVQFAAMLPYVFVPPIGGVISDRFNRRTVATGTLTVSFLSAFALGALSLSGSINVWLIFLLSLINGMSRSVEMPSTQAMTPTLVDRERLVNAVSLMAVVTHGSRLVGPLVTTAVLFVTHDAGWALMAAALLYGASLLMLQRVPKPPMVKQDSGENPLFQLWDGFRFSATQPVLAVVMLLVMFHCGFTMSYDALMPMYADENIGHNTYSRLMIFVGAGAFLGTIMLAGVASKWHRGKLLLVTGLLSGLAPAALALASSWPPAFVVGFVMGASQSMFMALTNAIVQTEAPDRYRGRALSIFLMLGGGIMAFGNLATGEFGDRFGVAPTLALPAVLFTSIIVLSMLGRSARSVYGRSALAEGVH